MEGIDTERVTAWFSEHVGGVEPPLAFELIAGGRSNLTFGVTDEAGARWVLRRPPLDHVLATAHDVAREFRIISALGPTDVPVPPAIGLCDDAEVNGAPFYVMGFVDGIIVRDVKTAETLTAPQRRRVSESLIDALAAIHNVDVDAVGLGDLGRRDGYVARQLRRWYGQFQQSKTRDLPRIDEVHEALVARIPDQGRATIVHGDYSLNNTLVGTDGSIAAVLDWEICALGDPLADLGYLLIGWAGPGELSVVANATQAGGFLRPDELLERYAAATGRDVAKLDFYMAFAYWKVACIVEGVYARYVAGAMGSRGDASEHQFFADLAEQAADAAHDAMERVA